MQIIAYHIGGHQNYKNNAKRKIIKNKKKKKHHATRIRRVRKIYKDKRKGLKKLIRQWKTEMEGDAR